MCRRAETGVTSIHDWQWVHSFYCWGHLCGILSPCSQDINWVCVLLLLRLYAVNHRLWISLSLPCSYHGGSFSEPWSQFPCFTVSFGPSLVSLHTLVPPIVGCCWLALVSAWWGSTGQFSVVLVQSLSRQFPVYAWKLKVLFPPFKWE